eukprot:gene10175-10335_t
MALRSVTLLAFMVCAAISFSPARASDEGNETLVFTEDFLFNKVGKQMLKLQGNLRGVANRTLTKAPATPKKEITMSCLNSVAPPPLNWKMWCPDKHANITQWVDEVGTTHRLIVLKPMRNMTAKKAVWFMTPLFPEHLNISGKVFAKHELWHPLDHKHPLDFKLAPGKALLSPPTLMTKLNEQYRVPENKQPPATPYQTTLWVGASDLALNLPRNRYVLGFEVMGFQAFTLVVQFKDSPAGLVVSVEVLLGAAAKGFDPLNPLDGANKAMAALANAMLFETIMKPYRKNGQFNGALNAVTRHIVEEFGNLQHFVPAAWDASTPGKIAAELETFKLNVMAATAKIPIKFDSNVIS